MTEPEPDAPDLVDRVYEWRRRHLPLPDEALSDLLHDDEYLVHSDHHLFSDFLANNPIPMALLGIAGWFSVVISRDPARSWWAILAGVLVLDLLLLYLAVKRLRTRYTTYAITNLRVLRVTGVLRRNVTYLAWSRVIGASCRQTTLDRLRGTGVIRIESAPEGSGLRVLSGLQDPVGFYGYMEDMLASWESGSPPPERPPTRGRATTLWERHRPGR